MNEGIKIICLWVVIIFVVVIIIDWFNRNGTQSHFNFPEKYEGFYVIPEDLEEYSRQLKARTEMEQGKTRGSGIFEW